MSLDKELMLAYKEKGDMSAFRYLYNKYTPEMISYVQLSLNGQNNKTDVEDIVQEAWIGIIKGQYRCEDKASLRTYIYTVLKNKICDYQRKKNAKKRYGENLSLEIADGYDKLELDINIVSLEEIYSLKDISEKLDNIIDKLPEEQRDVLLLYYYGGWTINEISKELNLPLENIKAKLRLSKKKIAKFLQNQI